MVFLFIFLLIITSILTAKIKIELKEIDILLKEPIHKKDIEKRNATRCLNSKNQNSTNKIKEFLEINDKFKILIIIKILGFIPIFKINLTKGKLSKIKNNKVLNNYINNQKKEKMMNNAKNIVKKFKFEIKELSLNAMIGCDSVILLAYAVPILSTIISGFLANKITENNKINYKINPQYNKRKFYKIKIRRSICDFGDTALSQKFQILGTLQKIKIVSFLGHCKKI